MMLVPHIAGGSPVISRIIAHNRRASWRRCSSGTAARNPATDASVRRIAALFLVAIPSCSHSRRGLPGHEVPVLPFVDKTSRMLGTRHHSCGGRSIAMTDAGGSWHVVFGATGAIGGAVVGELARAGRPVRAVSRGGQAPDGAQGMAADASDRGQAARAAAGASVIYHCASPPYTQWPELFPVLTGSILGAAEVSGAKLVFADNLYAYGPVDGPLREDLPAAARGPKGRIRAEMAAGLLAAHREGRARVVIGRASDYYGPHGTGSTAGQTVFGRILAGKKPQWTGRVDQPHTFHYLPDVARGLVVLADRREADGQVWHLPAAGPLTAQRFFDMIATAAGQP